MRARLASLLFAGGCTAIAPFGSFTTGDAGDGLDAGPALFCAQDSGPFTFDAGPPPGPGEICNRRDDDGDLRADEDLLGVDSLVVVPEITRVGEQMRSARGIRPDTFLVAFDSADPATLGRLRVAEVQIGVGVVQETLSATPTGPFDVASIRGGYAVVWTEAGQIRFARLSPCDLGADSLTLATANPTALSIASTPSGDGLFVSWIEGDALAGVHVGLLGDPTVGAVGRVSAGAQINVSVAATSDAGWVASVERADTHTIVVRRLGTDGGFGPASGPIFAPLPPPAGFGYDHVEAIVDVDGFLIVSADTTDGTTPGPARAREIELPGVRLAVWREYGAPGRAVLAAAANDGSVSSGLLMSLNNDPYLVRVGANPDGILSTDSLAGRPGFEGRGWRTLVGFAEGPYRYVAVGHTPALDLQYQAVLCP